MTARQIFNSMLIELSKVKAPSMLLEDFNYYFNKAINQYINKRYNIYDINQQTTDDLRVLKSSCSLTPTRANEYQDPADATSALSTKYKSLANLYGATYEINLPKDYLHMLNCVCIYKMSKDYSCYDGGSYVAFAAKRLTADAWSQIINDYYNRPLPERPYYYIHNVNISETVPTNPYNKTTGEGTDMNGIYKVVTRDGDDENDVVNLPRTFETGTGDQAQTHSYVQKETAYRYGNASNIRAEIRYGRDSSIFQLVNVQIDYIKTPQFIRLTPEQLDLTEDTSQVMEFPDYVCQEIINELVNIVMEATADPRLNTHIPVSQSIANPAQTQPEQAPQGRRG